MSTDSKNTVRRGRFRGWILFVACLLLLSLGATSYHKLADTALIAVRFSLVIVLSVLVIQERWNNRHDQARDLNDTDETVLQRMRRWYYDEGSGK